jgi:hypothetical protein
MSNGSSTSFEENAHGLDPMESENEGIEQYETLSTSLEGINVGLSKANRNDYGLAQWKFDTAGQRVQGLIEKLSVAEKRRATLEMH